jgi:molybdopterin synthase sulfur carrier subunit
MQTHQRFMTRSKGRVYNRWGIFRRLIEAKASYNSPRMATVRFTRNIQRHVSCPTREVAGVNLREVLDNYFRDNEQARGYVLDDQGAIRQHMVAFIDGELVRDRLQLSDAVGPNAVIDVIQGLSGG